MSRTSGSGRPDHQVDQYQRFFLQGEGQNYHRSGGRDRSDGGRGCGNLGSGNQDMGNRSGGRNNGCGGELDGEEGTLPSDCTLIPIPKRLGFGTSGRRVKVETNHFLTTKEGSTIYHYNV
uniref:Uncharacterized protein n=1 Tax=Fagus sylvatica TaxID=28930 RepID=A0A2N9G2Z1_FAGSY